MHAALFISAPKRVYNLSMGMLELIFRWFRWLFVRKTNGNDFLFWICLCNINELKVLCYHIDFESVDNSSIGIGPDYVLLILIKYN